MLLVGCGRSLSRPEFTGRISRALVWSEFIYCQAWSNLAQVLKRSIACRKRCNRELPRRTIGKRPGRSASEAKASDSPVRPYDCHVDIGVHSVQNEDTAHF